MRTYAFAKSLSLSIHSLTHSSHPNQACQAFQVAEAVSYVPSTTCPACKERHAMQPSPSPSPSPYAPPDSVCIVELPFSSQCVCLRVCELSPMGLLPRQTCVYCYCNHPHCPGDTLQKRCPCGPSQVGAKSIGLQVSICCSAGIVDISCQCQ